MYGVWNLDCHAKGEHRQPLKNKTMKRNKRQMEKVDMRNVTFCILNQVLVIKSDQIKADEMDRTYNAGNLREVRKILVAWP
jgi:hypothetical protein